MDYAQGNAARMVVHSPMPGVVVLNTIWLGGRMGTVQEGDQVRPECRSCRLWIHRRWKCGSKQNQVDLRNVHLGQKAEMHLDAYPGLSLPAELEQASAAGHQGQFSQLVRTFAMQFAVQGTDPRLLPDLSAALDVISAMRRRNWWCPGRVSGATRKNASRG